MDDASKDLTSRDSFRRIWRSSTAGLVPYVLLSLKVTGTKQYKLSLALAGLGLLSLAYPPQRELSYRLFMGISGLTSSSQFSPGEPFTLLGSLSFSAYLSPFHPLLIVGGLVFAKVSLDTFRRRLHAESILFYTCLSAIVFLLLLSLPNKMDLALANWNSVCDTYGPRQFGCVYVSFRYSGIISSHLYYRFIVFPPWNC